MWSELALVGLRPIQPPLRQLPLALELAEPGRSLQSNWTSAHLGTRSGAAAIRPVLSPRGRIRAPAITEAEGPSAGILDPHQPAMAAQAGHSDFPEGQAAHEQRSSPPFDGLVDKPEAVAPGGKGDGGLAANSWRGSRARGSRRSRRTGSPGRDRRRAETPSAGSRAPRYALDGGDLCRSATSPLICCHPGRPMRAPSSNRTGAVRSCAKVARRLGRLGPPRADTVASRTENAPARLSSPGAGAGSSRTSPDATSNG
jgi:hypothetical protein